ncbi:MAG TPA: ABC transporter permease [Bacteroidales bacterium]|nr:ABC transporter permease [Bacteroidales bacterium]
MIRNYILVALRNLRKHKFFTFISITGLSIGISCAILISVYILNELRYDTFNSKADRIYRVISFVKFGGTEAFYTGSPPPIAEVLRNEIPGIEEAGRFRPWGMFLVKSGQKHYKEFKGIYADPDIFNIFSIDLINGNSAALSDPNALFLSESAAKKYFSDKDPMGEELIINGEQPYIVKGVYRDIPSASHFHFDMMLAMSGLDESKTDEWLSNTYITYILLKKDVDTAGLQKKINELYYRYSEPQAIAFMGKTIDQLFKEGTFVEEVLQPLLQIHLHSDIEAEFEANGDIRYIYIFSAAVVLIMLLAVINFVNLSTVISSERTREVGIRRIMGSEKRYLVLQFLAESVIVTLIAVIIGVLLAQSLTPYFNLLSGKSLELPYSNTQFWITILSGGVLIGCMSGVYPALVLSSFKPVAMLSGKISKGNRGRKVRSFLVVFQFTVSTILIIGTITVYRQMNYIRNFKPGYLKEQVITIDVAGMPAENAIQFKNEVLKDKTFLAGTVSGFFPVANSLRNNNTFWKKGNRTPGASVNMQIWAVDKDYIKTMGMKIISGRDFSAGIPGDSAAIILNERAARRFDFDNPVGQEIQVYEGAFDSTMSEDLIRTMHIIGVVADFNWESLHENIGSLGMSLARSGEKVAFRFEPAKTNHAVKKIERAWQQINPGYPLDYTFLDKDYAQMYESENRTGRIISSFAIIAVVIACLGLFALASYVVEQRSKEIGIRKVMGASGSNIILILSREFTWLVIIAIMIAIPVSIVGIHLWLKSFVYKQPPGILHFIAVGAGVLILGLLTVAIQSYRAASADPADSVKTE